MTDLTTLHLLFINLTAYKYIAVIGSILFVLQIIFSVTGICPFKINPSIKGDFSITRHRFRLLMIRSFMGMILGFGWIGYLLYNHFADKIMLALGSFVGAILFAIAYYPVLKALCRIGEKNSFVLEDAMEKVGEVYIQIPANNNGRGKILISNKGTIREHEAITFDEKPIERGQMITIIGIENSVLIVTLL